MEAMSASMSRLCQMIHVVGLWLDTKERLQVVLEATRARGQGDNSFVPLFDEVLVSLIDKFIVAKKLVDDLDVRLQPMSPGSAMPASLTGLYGDNLIDALVALRLPTITPENVDPKVTLAAQHLVQQDTINTITRIYEEIIHKDHYVPEEDDRTVAFLDHRATLDDIIQKHFDPAANAAAPNSSVAGPTH